jgi:uncharacterized protein (DUF302 family)
MSRVTERLGRAAKKVGGKAQAAVEKAETRVQRTVRKGQGGGLRKVAEVVAFAGAAAVTGAVVEEAARGLRRRATKEPVGRPLAFEVHLPLPTDLAITRVTDALHAEGFGVLTRIDAHSTFREKLGADFRAYTILGACNPTLALRALTANPQAGLLLPCNVTIEAVKDGGSVVRIVNPIAMLEGTALAENTELLAVAAEAEKRLARAAEWLRHHGHATVL